MSRPRVLLLHAFPFDGRMWDEVRGPIEDAGWEVEAPDFPGSGSFADWAEELLAGEGPLVPVGSSMGGYVALELLRRAPERIAGLALVGTRATADARDVREARGKTVTALREDGVESFWGGLAQRLFSPAAPPEAVERARAIALDQDTDSLVAAVLAMRDRRDSTDLLAGIEVPTLVVAGADDAVVPLPEAVALARAIPGAELARLDGTGHLPAVEWPQELSRRLVRFLEEVE